MIYFLKTQNIYLGKFRLRDRANGPKIIASMDSYSQNSGHLHGSFSV